MTPGHINTGADADPGGRDSVAGDPAAAIAAMARREELASDTYGQGSTIGDLMDLPPFPDADSKHTGPVAGYPV